MTTPSTSIMKSGFPLPGDETQAMACLECRGPLELHQPDHDLPERILATCPRCRAWILIDVSERGELIITKLPDIPR